MADLDGRGLISTAWLAESLGDPDLRVFDVTVHLRPTTSGPYRIQSGRADCEGSHVLGAAFLDLAGDLSDPDAPPWRSPCRRWIGWLGSPEPPA